MGILMQSSGRAGGITSSVYGVRKCTVTNTDRNVIYYVVMFGISRFLCIFVSSGRTKPAII